MASLKKFTKSAVRNQLRHLDREIQHNSNLDIDDERSDANYKLSPDRGMDDYMYFQKRTSELYCYGRADHRIMVGWVCTAPQDLDVEKHPEFFAETYRFLCDRYGGEENVISAVVHNDESGEPHLHFLFLPVTKDTNPQHWQEEKVCANDVITRHEYEHFHPDWQRHLDEHGIDADVYTGVTKAQGGNRTVWEMKQERQYQHEHTRELQF